MLTADKAQGQMITDYIAGQRSSGEVSLGGTTETQWRAKYAIFFDRSRPGETTITVAPTIEVMTTVVGSYSGNATVLPYTDATARNPGLSQALVKSLFADFEKAMPQGQQ